MSAEGSAGAEKIGRFRPGKAWDEPCWVMSAVLLRGRSPPYVVNEAAGGHCSSGRRRHFGAMPDAHFS